jgi:hypothetical protein
MCFSFYPTENLYRCRDEIEGRLAPSYQPVNTGGVEFSSYERPETRKPEGQLRSLTVQSRRNRQPGSPIFCPIARGFKRSQGTDIPMFPGPFPAVLVSDLLRQRIAPFSPFPGHQLSSAHDVHGCDIYHKESEDFPGNHRSYPHYSDGYGDTGESCK